MGKLDLTTKVIPRTEEYTVVLSQKELEDLILDYVLENLPEKAGDAWEEPRPRVYMLTSIHGQPAGVRVYWETTERSER